MDDLNFKFNFDLFDYFVHIGYGELSSMGDGGVKRVNSVEDIVEFEKKQRSIVENIYKLPANDKNSIINIYYHKKFEWWSLEGRLTIPLIEFKKRFIKKPDFSFETI